MQLRITTLIENNPGTNPGLLCEHGLALLIEIDNQYILFDTGQSDAFLHNAKLLNKDISRLDYIVLSHGHYDHTGGMKALMPLLPHRTQLFVGDEFFIPKYKLTDEGDVYIGTRCNLCDIKSNKIKLCTVKDDLQRLTEHMQLFHQFTRSNEFEKPNPRFICYNMTIKGDANTTSKMEKEAVVDSFADEIVSVIDTDRGLVVIAGCSHVGIVNILDAIVSKTGKTIYMVVGGTHLVGASDERINRTIEAFERLEVKKIAVSHCTGDEAITRLRNHYGENFIYNNTGNVIVVN